MHLESDVASVTTPFRATQSLSADVSIASRQAVCAAIQQDIAGGRHLSCLSGPPGSGKTAILQALRQAYGHGLLVAITASQPGGLLDDVLAALDLRGGDGTPLGGADVPANHN